ncbi:MAG: CBS domain-containing protein [Verrucomicrobiae bacterium]
MTNPSAQKLPQFTDDFRFLYFSHLLGRKICVGAISHSIGKVADFVFQLADPYPEAIGIYIDHGFGKPSEFIPRENVQKIDDDAIFVESAPGGGLYPPFVDQPGLLLVNEHLMGKTILDMDGRRIEVVNDVHMLESKGRILLIHVDVSINGFLRSWGLQWVKLAKDNFISWKYVQPLCLEDAVKTDSVYLSIARKQIADLPAEDLADALEELSGHEQQAVFSALDTEKAAETLAEAEPRAQRQLIADLRHERARTILAEMTVPQVADLFSVLPHDEVHKLKGMLPPDRAERIDAILSEWGATASALMTDKFVAVRAETTVGELLKRVRESDLSPEIVSYVYITNPEAMLLGVVDLRELVLAKDDAVIGQLMVAPVVTADENDTREDISEIFAKYHFRLLPVTDEQDRLLGVLRYDDIMSGLVTRAKI